MSLSFSAGHGTAKISEAQFDKLLQQAESDFKDEMVRRVALLKVRDTEIFK